MDTLVICPKCEALNRVNLATAAQSKPICGKCKNDLPLINGVQELSDSSLRSLIQKSSRPVVVDFWAPWCGPCLAFAPTFQKAANEFSGKLVLSKINTEENSKISTAFGIKGIPTLIIFKNGIETSRQSGAMQTSTLSSYLSQFI